MADADHAEATGTALLTLWKVGRVELPRITKVYRDALAGLDGAKNAGGAGPGEVFALWVKVRGELQRVVVLSAGRTEAAGDAVCRAIAEYTGADADGRNSSSVAGQELWRRPRRISSGSGLGPAWVWTRQPTAQESPSQLASEVLSVVTATGVSWVVSS
jgi:hypothetical protein